MISKATIGLLLFLLACVIAAGSMALYFRGNAIDYKSQRDKATDALHLANATIDDMQVRQREVAALDAKYTKELADAKAKLDALQQCVSSGKCGLRINAKCPTVNTSGTASVDDAASPRLTESAQRDYFILRERIEIAGKQIAGLQQYIKDQCKN
ncbi:lysis protein [Pantoea sp. GM01]|uniref:lysis protein n=1 Tax=Pantoea sp. GM01 TaxID=1144320 RepID=UPI000270FFD3|nr:lysis protein [Pantoea sp. GM01]EJL90232.1 Bacteriophage lysis protein [Pantoea sp. GM01]